MLYNSGVRAGKKNQFYFQPGTWPNKLPIRVSSVTYFSEKICYVFIIVKQEK